MCVLSMSPSGESLPLPVKVVDLTRLRLLHDADEVGGVGHIAVVEEVAYTGQMWVLIQMIYPVGVDETDPALDTVHCVALIEQELS